MEDKRGTYGDETVFNITPIEMHLSKEWQQQKILLGRLHSKFEKVQNYLFTIDTEERMLTVMCEGNTLLPDSIVLRYADYEKLKRQGEFFAEKSGDYIQINQMKIELLITSDCSLLELSLDKYKKESFEEKRKEIRDFIACSERRSDFERLPKRYSQSLYRLADSLVDNDSKQLMVSIAEIIGLGRGLTPAGDDAVIGVLAGYLLKASLARKEGNYLQIVEPILLRLCKEKLTTEVSLKYLKCACRGAFSQDLCKLIRVLSGELQEDIRTLLNTIRETGHSSGMDMLYGLDTILQRG